MNFYEHTLIARQDLSKPQFDKIRDKYKNLINQTDGKVLKTEEWGILNFSRKIKKFNKGYYIHYKFEGSPKTIETIKKSINIDREVLRYLIVKYKQLDLKTEFFKNQ
jgi:small subunit ribosomal protein S6